jgi:serine/threonine protein kinase
MALISSFVNVLNSVSNSDPRYFPKTVNGAIHKNARVGDYQQVANGKVKDVYKRVIENNGKLALDSETVLYRPRWFYQRTELNGEAKKGKKIETSLAKKSIKGETYIQTRFKKLGDGSIVAPAAEGDLERVNLKELTKVERYEIALQVLKGMNHLHKAGFINGDAKLDNILIFRDKATGKLIARLSDFGKAEECGENEVRRVEGNVRNRAPEPVISRSSERFSTGLLILQILVPGASPELFEEEAVENRKGIEAQMMRHAGRPNHKGVSDYLGYWVSYIIARLTGKPSLKHAERDQNVVHAYADKVLKSAGDDPALREALSIVKELTRANPKDRILLDEAVWRFETNVLPKTGLRDADESVF